MTDPIRTTRRAALALGAAALAAPAIVPAAARAHGFAPPVVLVHGAWHGAWAWSKLLHPLAESGVMATAVELSGLGANSHRQAPEIGLRAHVQDLSNHLFYNDLRGAVVVGHSYGGCVLSGALAQDRDRRIAHAIYLDALILDDGEALASHVPPQVAETFAAATEAGAMIPPRPPEAREKIWGLTGDLAEWADARLRPMSARCFTETIEGSPWRDGVRYTYQRCTQNQNPLFDAFMAQAEADPRFRTQTINGHHDVMAIDPALMRDALLAAF
ncbi:MAG: alpha/beta fold hydrolase [Pseudomonadota bacterium]